MEYEYEYTAYFLYLVLFWLLAISSGTFICCVIRSLYEYLLDGSMFSRMLSILHGVYTLTLYICILVSPIFIFWDFNMISLFFTGLLNILLGCAIHVHHEWVRRVTNV